MADFSPQSLLQVLQRYPRARRYWLAFSGGIDSSVLLHALAQLGAELPSAIGAVYIDHGLQAESQQWSDHCRTVCQGYGVAFQSIKAQLVFESGDSLEEKAREARYAVLVHLIEANDILLTAQHKDDQAETFLLQALRGAGPKGLASMPVMKAFGKGWHLRPLLNFSKQQLIAYAQQQRLDWMSDPSNLQTRFQRNYIRNKVLPLLKQSWPGATDALVRSAAHCAESSGLLRELADIDLSQIKNADNTLSRDGLNALSPVRRANLIRAWLSDCHLRAPDHRRMQQIIAQLETSAQDRSPCVVWPGAEIRSYRDKVYAMPPLPAIDESRIYQWRVDRPLQLQDGELSARKVQGEGLSLPDQAQLEVRFRQGGERCQPVGQAQSRELKTLFQEWAVPPWLRSRIPLIYIDGELAVVSGFCQCQPFATVTQDSGWQFEWKSPTKC